MHKFKTWFRIKKRLFMMYLENYSSDILRVIKFIVNLAIFITIPLWVGIVYQILYLFKLIEPRKNVEKRAMSGNIWFWEQFKNY